MIDLISIHIPKTGGTSFYNILKQVYGKTLSMSYRRKDYLAAIKEYPDFEASIESNIQVLHGHLYYPEVASIQQKNQSRVICWLRNPVDRVVSNYEFFIRGLQNPARNPKAYELNKHRINETLVEYASLEENRNRMTDFLEGIALKELFFVGLLESFEQDVRRLGKMLDWKAVDIPKMNAGGTPSKKEGLSLQVIKTIEQLNAKDCDLYAKACDLPEILL